MFKMSIWSKMGKLLKVIIICVIAILNILLLSSFALLMIPFIIYRRILFHLAPLIKPQLGKMVNLPALPSLFLCERKGLFVVLEMDIEGGVDFEEFKLEFMGKIINLKKEGHLVYPELRQVFTQWMGYLFWKNVPNFSIDDHILWWNKSTLNSMANQEDVQPDLNQIRKELLLKEFAPNKPIWDLHLVEHGGITKLFFRWHHSYFDGFSIIKLLSKLFATKQNKATPKIKGGKNTNPIGLFWKLIKAPYIQTELLLNSMIFNRSDWQRNITQNDHQFNMEGIRLSQSNYIPLEKLRRIAQAHQVNVYSVVLAGICGGIRRFMLETGCKLVNNPTIGFASAKPNHPDDKLRNHVYGCFTFLPFGQSDPGKRLQMIFSRVESVKNSYFEAWAYYSILPSYNLPIPLLKRSFPKKWLMGICPFFYSGFPGPKDQWYWRDSKFKFTGFFWNSSDLEQPLFITSINDTQGFKLYLFGIKSVFPSEGSLRRLSDLMEEELDLLLGEKLTEIA